MKCPHCLENFFEAWTDTHLDNDVDGYWTLRKTKCPSCNKFIFKFLRVVYHPTRNDVIELQVYPIGIARSPISSFVDKKFSDDYKESVIVLADSPKASAALSRRCLQNLLREKANVKSGELSDEIQQVLDSKSLPSHLSDNLDVVRNIGNFAAHPNKSKSTGEIVDVEAGEAEWNLDILEGLFDFYFVQPELMKQKKQKLNQKLQDAGKQPMK